MRCETSNPINDDTRFKCAFVEQRYSSGRAQRAPVINQCVGLLSLPILAPITLGWRSSAEIVVLNNQPEKPC